MVVACSYKILWPKIDFLIFLPHFPLSTGHFFQHGGQARKMQKKIIFFAEMAYIHVGTKYIKRPWDFDNFLEFWCTLMIIHPWAPDNIRYGAWASINSGPCSAHLLVSNSLVIFWCNSTIAKSTKVPRKRSTAIFSKYECQCPQWF